MSPDAQAQVGPRMSRRLSWHQAENRLAAATEARRARRQPIVDLTESNPTAVGLGAAPAALAEALAAPGAREALAHYAPSPRGRREARVAIAAATAGSSSLDPDRLLLTASSSESYGTLFKLLGDPGDDVLIPEPSYPLFDYLARLEGLDPRPYRLAFDGAWHIDLASVRDALDAAERAGRRIAALVVVSPHNPTGAVLTRAELEALDEICAARGVALIADQVFADYVHAPRIEHVGLVCAEPTRATTFTLGGLSKSCGLPQLKLGWIAVGGPTAAAELALHRLELIADTYLSVSTAVQVGAAPLLALGAGVRARIAARVADNRASLRAAVPSDAPLDLLPADGGWSAILRVPAIRTDEDWALLLLERDGILVHPGYFFELTGGTYLVLSLLPERATFQAAARVLVARVGEIAESRERINDAIAEPG